MAQNFKLTSIIRNVEPAVVLPIVKTLLEAGVSSVEVSLSEKARGLGCLKILREAFPPDRLELGAGTVTTREEVDTLCDMGIEFFFTPGFDRELTAYAIEQPIRVIPGVFSPGEVQVAATLGLKLMKLFPANALPMHYVKSLKGPFPGLDFLAVGGVSADNLVEFRSAGFCGAALGSNLVPQQATLDQLEQIFATARRCVAAIEEG